MSTKLKFTVMLACSIAFLAHNSSYAAPKYSRTSPDVNPSALESAPQGNPAAAPTNNAAPQGGAKLEQGTANSANTIDSNEFDKIFNDNIAKISKEREAMLAKIDQKFAENLDSFTAGSNDAKAIQAVQDTLNTSGEKYFDAVAKDLSGIPTHLKNKMNELNNKIMQVNAKATSDSIARAKVKATKLTEHVDSQSTAFLGQVVNNFSMESITGDEQIDKLIFNALGKSQALGAAGNVTKTNAQVQDAVKAYITLNAPSLSLSK